jgi:hypothetical protein
MSALTEELRLQAESCLREADAADEIDRTALLFRAAQLHAHALRLETFEREQQTDPGPMGAT